MDESFKTILRYFIIVYVSLIILVVWFFGPTLLFDVSKKEMLPNVLIFLLEFLLLGIGLTFYQLIQGEKAKKKNYLKKVQEYKHNKAYYNHSPTYLRDILEKLNTLHEYKFDFTGYDLSNIQLNDLKLYESNFYGCNLQGCDFSHTDISRANFRNVKIDSKTILKYSIYDRIEVNEEQKDDFLGLGLSLPSTKNK